MISDSNNKYKIACGCHATNSHTDITSGIHSRITQSCENPASDHDSDGQPDSEWGSAMEKGCFEQKDDEGGKFAEGGKERDV